MDINTTRFGIVAIEPSDVLRFPEGLIGMEADRQWVLLADGENDLLGWLQSVDRPELALAVVSPRRFVPQYRARVGRGEVAPLCLQRPQDAHVLVIVSKHQGQITLNLKSPLVIHVEARLGRQVVTKDEQPLRHVLRHSGEQPLKKSA